MAGERRRQQGAGAAVDRDPPRSAAEVAEYPRVGGQEERPGAELGAGRLADPLVDREQAARGRRRGLADDGAKAADDAAAALDLDAGGAGFDDQPPPGLG